MSGFISDYRLLGAGCRGQLRRAVILVGLAGVVLVVVDVSVVFKGFKMGDDFSGSS